MSMRWILRNPSSAPPVGIEDIASELAISPFLAGLLWQRGLQSRQAMDVFLSPNLRHLASPTAWPGIEQAAQLLAQGLTAGQTLAVWGDYDVDGVTATALVIDVLRRRGIQAEHHIPERQSEGYGVNVAGIEALAARGVKLLLTVDCGISDVAALSRARELEMTVVVSDHHLPGDTLPPAHAICNPRLGDCPCPDLAGVGVAFFLMAAVNRLLPGAAADMREVLDLVALGTIADVVPLTGQNRVLTKNGMLLLAEAKRPGIAALKEASGFSISAVLEAGHVGFGLAPRINAAGRMGRANIALDMLLAPDLAAARPLAAKLDLLNKARRKEENLITTEAIAQAQAQTDSMGHVLYAPHWHPGVIGIVASRVVEARYRPTLLLTGENGRLKGSGRSIAEFDLYAGLVACGDLLLGFGGHRQAAGLQLAPENLEALRLRFHQAVLGQLGPEPLSPRLKVDAELNFSTIDFTLLKELELLQPFGMGNPEPVFASAPVQVSASRIVGKNHVFMHLRDAAAGITLRGKAWRRAEDFGSNRTGQVLRVAFSPKIDRYNGLASIDLIVKDWKSQDSPLFQEVTPCPSMNSTA